MRTIEIHVPDCLFEFLYPFKKWLKELAVVHVTKEAVGFYTEKVTFVLLDKDKKVFPVPDNEEIRKICELWDEYCLSDLIHNRFLDHITQTMQGDTAEINVKFS